MVAHTAPDSDIYSAGFFDCHDSRVVPVQNQACHVIQAPSIPVCFSLRDVQFSENPQAHLGTL
jgi:hypothetical protein